MNKAMIDAINEVAANNGLERADILKELEAALMEAFLDANPSLWIDGVRIHPRTGDTEILFEGTWVPQDFSEGELGRVSANAVKRSLLSFLTKAQAVHTSEYYRPLIGTVVTGRVEHSDRRGTWVKLQGADAFVPARERHSGERLRRGDNRAFVVIGVNDRDSSGEVLLSRVHGNLIPGLIKLNVPEVESGLIEIVASARKPGERSLTVLRGVEGVAVVPAIKGVSNNRLRAIRKDLGKEFFDFVVWHDNMDTGERLRSLWSPTRLARMEWEETADELSNIMVSVFEADLERTQSLAPLVAAVLNSGPIRVDVASEKTDIARHRPVKDETRKGLCNYRYASGKLCVNHAEPGSERCSLHQVATGSV